MFNHHFEPIYITCLIALTYLLIPIRGYAQDLNINPTGTYALNTEIKQSDEESYGSFGDLQIKLIEPNSIVISLYYCTGKPRYAIGSFIDTLPYFNHYTEYKTSQDSSCSVSFSFTDSTVYIKQTSEFINFCGFGYGVLIDDTLKKTSSDIPIIKDFLTDEIIKSPQLK